MAAILKNGCIFGTIDAKCMLKVMIESSDNLEQLFLEPLQWRAVFLEIVVSRGTGLHLWLAAGEGGGVQIEN